MTRTDPQEVQRVQRAIGEAFNVLRTVLAVVLPDESHDLDEGMVALATAQRCLMRAACGLPPAAKRSPDNCPHETLRLPDSDGDKTTRTCDECGATLGMDRSVLAS